MSSEYFQLHRMQREHMLLSLSFLLSLLSLCVANDLIMPILNIQGLFKSLHFICKISILNVIIFYILT